MAAPNTLEEFQSGAARGRILALVLCGALLAIALTAAIAYRHGSFAKTTEIYFDTDSATGLPLGTAVTLSGFRIGEVSAVALQPDLQVRITLNIRAEYRAGLREDAKAELVKEDLLKPAVIAIDRGKNERPLTKPRIEFERPESFADMAEDLKDRIAPILDDVKQITGTLRERQHRLGEIMEEAANASRELAQAAKEINTMSADVRKQVAAIGNQSVSALTEANQTVVRLNGVVAEAEKSVATINQSLPQLVQEAQSTLGSLRDVARDARTISQAAAETVPETLRSVQPAAAEAREIVRGVTAAWPIRDLLPPPAPAAMPLNSMDSRKLREPAGK
jgi:phospholipid/cholesterol/gamma-HCH transport system substrate-binding protein